MSCAPCNSAGDAVGAVDSRHASKNFRRALIAVAILLLAFLLVSFALVTSGTQTDENRIHTGSVQIDLNGGVPVFDGSDTHFEPGATETRTFTITNTGTWGVWYKVYFANIAGGLSDVVDVTLVDDAGNTLYSGKASGCTFDADSLGMGDLAIGQTRQMTITLHYPEQEDNTHASDNLSFTLEARAVQTKNNATASF